MGQNVFAINDKLACFGLESRRKPTGRAELHLILSKSGARSLLDALSYVTERKRKSTIVINCEKCASKLRFIFFKRLEFLVPSVESEGEELKFESEETAACVTLPRPYLATAVEMSRSILAGNNDVAFRFADKIAIWIWGEEGGP